MTKKMPQGWSLVLVFTVIGFLVIIVTATPKQSIEDIHTRLTKIEEELHGLKNQLQTIENVETIPENTEDLKLQAGLLPLEGTGLIIKMDDSTKEAKSGENPNLYLIHDDDLLRVINELRAAGAEAISINGQRLVETSEIRCAGPTLSVNNVRSSAPYEIHAIGDKNTLENAIKMRGGVAETLKVWGIRLEVETSNNVYIPPYKGTRPHTYSHVTEERTQT